MKSNLANQQIIRDCSEFHKTAFSPGETSVENFWQVPQATAYEKKSSKKFLFWKLYKRCLHTLHIIIFPPKIHFFLM